MLSKKQYLTPEMVVEVLEMGDIVTSSVDITIPVSSKGLTTGGMAEGGFVATAADSANPWDTVKGNTDLG